MLNSDYKPMSCLQQAGAEMSTLQLVLPKLIEATFFSKKIGLHRNELIILRRLDARKAQCLVCIRKFLVFCTNYCQATAEQGQGLRFDETEDCDSLYPVWAEECLQLASDYQALHADTVAHHKGGFTDKLLGLRLIIEGLQLTALLMLSASQPDALEVLARYAIAAWQTGMQAECIACNKAEEEAIH